MKELASFFQISSIRYSVEISEEVKWVMAHTDHYVGIASSCNLNGIFDLLF